MVKQVSIFNSSNTSNFDNVLYIYPEVILSVCSYLILILINNTFQVCFFLIIINTMSVIANNIYYKEIWLIYNDSCYLIISYNLQCLYKYLFTVDINMVFHIAPI